MNKIKLDITDFFDLVKSSTENFILKYYGSQLNLNPFKPN